MKLKYRILSAALVAFIVFPAVAVQAAIELPGSIESAHVVSAVPTGVVLPENFPRKEPLLCTRDSVPCFKPAGILPDIVVWLFAGAMGLLMLSLAIPAMREFLRSRR